MSTEEDLVPGNKKRHDINLTISQRTNGYADQTPTPTRFIRNCEEVGLFQDLQNVNPFEETFRKAVEAVHQGETLILGKADDKSYIDDTLHTPNVFPLIQEVLIRKEVHHTKPVIEVKPPVTARPDIPKRRKYRKRKAEPVMCQPTFVVPEKNITFMLPIPRSPSSSVNYFSPKYFSAMSRNVTNNNCSASASQSASKNPTVERTKKSDIMEYNRLAQMRTRQKRKHYLEYLEDSNKKLTEKCASLEKRLKTTLDENTKLKTKIALFEDKASIGFDASTQTTPPDKKLPPGFPDHDYILQCEPGAVIKKPFKKRTLQPKLCTNCNKNPI